MMHLDACCLTQNSMNGCTTLYCAESGQQDGGLERERQEAQAAVDETRGQKQQTKVSQRKLNQVKVGCQNTFAIIVLYERLSKLCIGLQQWPGTLMKQVIHGRSLIYHLQPLSPCWRTWVQAANLASCSGQQGRVLWACL